MIPRAGQAQAVSPGVFSTLQTDLVPDIGIALEPATMRSRVVGLDTQQLTAARLGQQALRLNLFDDAALNVRIDRVRPTRSGYFITGSPQGVEWGEVRLVVNGPVMVGTVVTPEGKYTIRSGGAGRHIIRQVDPTAEPPLHDDTQIPLPSSPPQGVAPGDPLDTVSPQAVVPGDPFASSASLAADSPEDQPTEDGSEVRVLIVYTPALQAAQGGAAGMQALIDLMIQTANDAFESSGIDTRLILAHTALVDYVEAETGVNMSRLLFVDGYMDEVLTLRNEHAADLVHLLTRYVSGRGGLAGVISDETLRYEYLSAFAITATASEEVFTHETGHNFGMVHDRFTDLPGNPNPIYPYAFGYVNNRAFEAGAPESARWRTVMSYPNRCNAAGVTCQRLVRFANPDQTWLGDPLGVPANDPETGIEGPADARLTINRTARWVGSYRSEACTEFKVSPEAPVAPLSGSEVVFSVETGYGCVWEVSNQSGFLTPETDARQAGTGFISISVQPNDTGAERLGTLTVAGTTIQVRQLVTDAGICGRTPSVVGAIAGDTACDQVTDQQLSQVTSLELGDQGLSVLQAGDFEGLSNLTSLRLNSNRFTELPEDLFSGLANLESLRLSGNRLTELPAGLFAGLSKLNDLRLSDNDLEALPEGVFSGLSQLRFLALSRNGLSALAEDAFAGLSQLQILLLTENELSELPAGVFAGLSRLRELHMGANPYQAMPTGLFSDLEELERLYLYGSPLTGLPDGVFADLSNLVILDLHRNRLSELAADIFRGLSRLQSLFLPDNELTTLPGDIFSGLTVLQFLLLENNQLSDLPNGIFSGLTSLERLDLKGNRVDPLPLELSLEIVGDDQIKAIAPTGAPFALELPLTVSSGAEVAGDTANSITIPAGAVESVPSSVTRLDEDTDTATVDIASLPALPKSHEGYALTKDATLPIEVQLPEEILPPAQVTGVQVARGFGSLRVSWNAVSRAEGYKVQWKSGDEDYDEESRQAVIAGGDTTSYTITGLTDGAEYTVRVLATRSGADDGTFSDEILGATRSGDPDVNGDGTLDGDDAQIMWYAYRFASLVGDGETGGTETSRRRFLAGYSGLDDPTDEDLRAMVARANTWRTEGLNEDGDINADGMIDESDARAMYYAYTYESLLGDGEDGGAERFRTQLLGPLAGTADPTDEDLKAMLRRANELREAYGTPNAV